MSSSFTPLKMQEPELVNQLKEKLPGALFEKLSGSLSLDRDRLKFAEYKVQFCNIPSFLGERTDPTRTEKGLSNANSYQILYWR